MHGRFSDTTRYVWISMHGYGQLAKHFIKRFEFLDPALHVVIAPDGLNRFYFEGLNDRPVSSWMTSEDRLDEIADFIGFLESLREKIGWDKNQNIKVIYFGFSQGVTALFRWLVDATPRVDYLLLWAGGVPDDILFDRHRSYFNSVESHYFLGDKDPFFSPEKFTLQKGLLLSADLRIRLHVYEGVHKVDEQVLSKWVKENLLA